MCALINMTALHPEASQTSFEAFALVCKDDKLMTAANFAPLLETALVFVDRHAKVRTWILQNCHILSGVRFGSGFLKFVNTVCLVPFRLSPLPRVFF